MLLDSAGAISFCAGFFALLTFVSIRHRQLLDRRSRTARQEGHRRATPHLQEVLQTVPGAQFGAADTLKTAAAMAASSGPGSASPSAT